MKTKTKKFLFPGDSITDKQIEWLVDKLIAEAQRQKKENELKVAQIANRIPPAKS